MIQTELLIAGRPIGPAHPTFVIAEIGVNHDGSLRRALELVDLARAAGADAVKLQIFTAANLMHASSAFADYQQQRVSDADPAAMLRRYELPPAAVAELVGAIRNRGLLPIATPFSPADVDVIAQLDLPAVKIASPDIVNRPLLQRVAELGRPMIASTGAATLEEIATACDWFYHWHTPAALLHCISSYPTPLEQANLCWIRELVERFGLPTGYSDHTTHVSAGALAVGAGACVVEKHLTYDTLAAGPDHAASADPWQFAEYVKQIRIAERMRGTPGKHVLEIEQDVRRVSRQSLVAVSDVPAGQLLVAADLTVQRPGTGISATEFDSVVGRRTCRPVPCGAMLQWDMLEDKLADAA